MRLLVLPMTVTLPVAQTLASPSLGGQGDCDTDIGVAFVGWSMCLEHRRWCGLCQEVKGHWRYEPFYSCCQLLRSVWRRLQNPFTAGSEFALFLETMSLTHSDFPLSSWFLQLTRVSHLHESLGPKSCSQLARLCNNSYPK